jgi:hypothetical protein
MNKVFFNIIFILLLFTTLKSQIINNTQGTIKLDDGWKFITGDNIKYARPDFDDTKWKNIKVDKPWEKYGYDNYDGIAWYRIKVFIPSDLIKNARLKDKIVFKMGKIDDIDQVYLNGQMIGENGVTEPVGRTDLEFRNKKDSKWRIERIYSLNTTDPRIHWDSENTIAVRVYDSGENGGIYSGDLKITTMQPHEYFVLDYDREPFKFKNNYLQKDIWISNTSDSHIISGRLDIVVINEIKMKKVMKKFFDIYLQPKQTRELSYQVPESDHQNTVEYSMYIKNDDFVIRSKEGTPYILTPVPGAKPSINGAKVYGERTGKPFLNRIAATGIRPMKFRAINLPTGLRLNENTGIISGKVDSPGEYKVRLIAENSEGKSERELRIEIGDKIALTPPMGWNSWNCWGLSADQNKVTAAANAFISTGLADHGWTYINIDDGWEIPSSSSSLKRDKNGNILVNDKFPDIKKLGEEIHAAGLKFGIYSSPGESTCGGFTASFGFEIKDAKSYENWGIDYLKYDWCSYELIAKDKSQEELMKPYYVMRNALNKVNRDIVFSLCQYGMSDVWKWGDKVGGNLWRTTGDITDSWESLKSIGFNQVDDAKYCKPGNWNDPDMLIVGLLGSGKNLHYTHLTPDEQYTHISLWALLSAPMLIGCDLEKLDPFTLNLLTNDEVIAVDQDPLSYQARRMIKTDSIQVWVKKLENGPKAFGVFNLSDKPISYELSFKKIGLSKNVTLINLWSQREVGLFKNSYKIIIPSHGVKLLKTL